MCGIFGILTHSQNQDTIAFIHKASNSLFKLSESRGKEAAGIAILNNQEIKIYKEPNKASSFIKRNTYKQLFQENRLGVTAILGHSRLATNGQGTNNHNNQPVISKQTVGVHNGIIVNDTELWSNVLKEKPSTQVDSEVILRLLENNLKTHDLIDSTIQAFKKIEGAASVAILHKTIPYLLLATNTGSLYYVHSRTSHVFIFASEAYILNQFKKQYEEFNSKRIQVTRILPNTGVIIDLSNLQQIPFLFKETPLNDRIRLKKLETQCKIKDLSEYPSLPKIQTLGRSLNSLKSLSTHKIDPSRISKLKRCKRCILPETMPLIKFDSDGVCNYCHNHKKIKPQGQNALEKFLSHYRSKTGEPDCIVAFSGGRDSSYGLHYAKKVLNMNPIAYTYDWGMVTDLARRNQSRITAKLGIEHIVVSADITQKRANIRKNVEAWLKKPDLGMIPLFMAGDKQAEYYAEELKQKTGIKLVIYCRGNELENEEFKWGHCGIKNGSPGGVLHNLSWMGKLQLATYYGLQYINNPAYINSSLWDTLFAYRVAYLMPLDFMYLWHYVPWDEKTIISTLQKEYNWEALNNSRLTWRIDDGSVPFYNYIYFTVQGFTENDTFRSNQIRECIISRKTALDLVMQENQPRYEGLQWYFDQLNLDGDKILTTIDQIPKLY